MSGVTNNAAYRDQLCREMLDPATGWRRMREIQKALTAFENEDAAASGDWNNVADTTNAAANASLVQYGAGVASAAFSPDYSNSLRAAQIVENTATAGAIGGYALNTLNSTLQSGFSDNTSGYSSYNNSSTRPSRQNYSQADGDYTSYTSASNNKSTQSTGWTPLQNSNQTSISSYNSNTQTQRDYVPYARTNDGRGTGSCVATSANDVFTNSDYGNNLQTPGGYMPYATNPNFTQASNYCPQTPGGYTPYTTPPRPAKPKVSAPAPAAPKVDTSAPQPRSSKGYGGRLVPLQWESSTTDVNGRTSYNSGWTS